MIFVYFDITDSIKNSVFERSSANSPFSVNMVPASVRLTVHAERFTIFRVASVEVFKFSYF